MNTKTLLTHHSRDSRLLLFLGIANWFLFLDHIPNNSVNLVTLRNFGFSGAADVFIFISGYAAALAFAGIMLERGAIVGLTRVFRRAWQLYAAFIVLFAIYAVSIGDAAARLAAPDIIYEFNVAGLLEDPVRTVTHGLLLQSKALNLDVLQIYVVLMACFPAVLWMMLREPDMTMAGSFGLYLAARQFGWNLPSFPDGSWYFNPFCWQVLFILGAWCALGGARRIRASFRSPLAVGFGIAYLLFALVIAMAGRFPALEQILPAWLPDAFLPVDKTNLAPYRLLHFIVVALFATRLIGKDRAGLNRPILRPLIICGEQSIAVFCAGVLLSFAGHFVLLTGSGSLIEQILVSVAGIAIMTVVAAYIAWSKRQDHPLPARLGRTASLKAG